MTRSPSSARVQRRSIIETALQAQKIGRQIFVVVEKFTELELILRYSEQLGVRPTIGMRVSWPRAGRDGGSRRAATGRSSASR